MPPVSEGKLLTISQAGKRLNRTARALREWEANGSLPEHLYPARDERGNRRYSEELVEHIREWLIAKGRRPNTSNLIQYRSRS